MPVTKMLNHNQSAKQNQPDLCVNMLKVINKQQSRQLQQRHSVSLLLILIKTFNLLVKSFIVW